MYSPTKQNIEVRMGINKTKKIIYGTRILYNYKYTDKYTDKYKDKYSYK